MLSARGKRRFRSTRRGVAPAYPRGDRRPHREVVAVPPSRARWGLIDEAWRDFIGAEGATDTGHADERFDPQTSHLSVFVPWFFSQWLPDPHASAFPDLAARRATVAAQFLKHRQRHLDPLLVRYVEAFVAGAFSFHEVMRVEPDRGFALRDLLLEREQFVLEHRGSWTAAAGDILFAQIVHVDGIAVLHGRDAVAALIDQIERGGTRMSPPLDRGITAMLRRELGS